MESFGFADSASYFLWIKGVIESELLVKDAYLEGGIPTFVISPDPQIKEKIDRINATINSRDLYVFLRRKDGELYLRVLSMKVPKNASLNTKGVSLHRIVPILLFFGTIATVSISGCFTAQNFVAASEAMGKPHSSVLELTLMYTIALMSILGLHELGLPRWRQ